MANATDIPHVLNIGLEHSTIKLIQDIVKEVKTNTISMSSEAIIQRVEPEPSMILIAASNDLDLIDLGRSLRNKYPSSQIYLIFTKRAGFERKTFLENGYSDAFLLPVDTTALRTAMCETIAKVSNGRIRAYRPVNIIDFEPGGAFDFDTNVYLPTNNRYVRVTIAGETLDLNLIDKLKKSKYNNLYVPVEQMKKFYQYTAGKLRDLGSDKFGNTERREKLSVAVRDLVSGLFSDKKTSNDAGLSVLKDCGEIVRAYILQGASAEWFVRIQQVLGEHGDHYSHSANVSTLAALFSMGLGIGKPEDLALAGLLHDIGSADLPADIQELDEEDMTPPQLEKYQTHPELSAELIKSRKIAVQETVVKAILQHHEHFNGSGFPKGFFGDRIIKEAQVLALADKFDYLTRVKIGRPLVTPLEAVQQLRMEQIRDPSNIRFNPEMLKNLLTLFPSA